LPQIASGDASPRVNRRLDLCQHDLIAEHTDAIRSCEVERVVVRVVQRRTRLNPVLSAHPASNLGLSSPAVIGVRVATEAGAEQFVLGDGWQSTFTRQSRDVGCRHPAASRSQPSDAIIGTGNNPAAVVGRRHVPQVEFRLQRHITIVAAGPRSDDHDAFAIVVTVASLRARLA